MDVNRKGMREDDIDVEISDSGEAALVHKAMRKSYVRESRRCRNIPSRDWCARDYCGATRHVSRRNGGRKPRKTHS